MNTIRNSLIAMMVMMTSIATASELQFKMLGGYGYWKTIVAEDDDFPVVCTITSELDRNAAFMINFSHVLKHRMTIDLVKNSWKIPEGLKTRVWLTFDNKAPYVFVANGVSDSGLMIDMMENGVNVEVFMTMFTTSRNLEIEFEGSEVNWSLSLTGTKQATNIFHKCVNTLPKENPFEEPTQPFKEFNRPMQSQPYMFNPSLEDQKAFSPKDCVERPLAPLLPEKNNASKIKYF